MMKTFMMILVLLISAAFMNASDEGIATSPSPEGDAVIGADAAASGTDITDKKLQSQEEVKGDANSEKNDMQKDNQSEEDRTNIDVK